MNVAMSVSVLGKRKRNKKEPDPNTAVKKKSKSKKSKCEVYGDCTKTMKKCKSHRAYLCPDCHRTDSKLYLIELAQYLEDAAIPCSWKNHKEISYPKHNKRYHNTKDNHKLGFKANTKISSKQRTISFAKVNVNNNNHNNNDNNNIEIEEDEDIDLLQFEDNNNHNNNDNNNIDIEENVIYMEQPTLLQIEKKLTSLQIEDNIITYHVSPQRIKKQQTLDKYKYNKHNKDNNPIQMRSELNTETVSKKKDISYYKSPEYIHFNHIEWSKIKQIANQYKLGCKLCFVYDNKKQTIYAKTEYPLTFTIFDFMNNTEQWNYVSNHHRKHPQRAGHQYSIGKASKSNHFNDEAISTQIESYLHILRYKEPDTAYTRNLHLVQRSNGFTGNIGLSKERMKYYDRITHLTLKGNVRKQLNKPRSWGGPDPFQTTMDIYSCGAMSTEIHVLFKLLPIQEKLTFIALPFCCSPITSKDGQSKTLKDSAARHLNAILHDIDKSVFKNELIIFINYTLCKYTTCPPTITAEELIHKILFDETNDNYIRRIKTLIDVAWHHQPYEEYAETAAKLVGDIFSEDRRRLLFDKLSRRALDHAWLPSFDHYDKLKQDLLLQCKVDGIRGIKTDSRSSKDAKAFTTLEDKAKDNVLPYE